MTNFSSGDTLDISGAEIYKIENGVIGETQLTNTSQLGTSETWGKHIVNENEPDTYKLYFFFYATSLNFENCHYIKYGDDYNNCQIDNNIHQVIADGAVTKYYAIEFTVNERYESDDELTDTYSYEIHLGTNDPDTSLDVPISINHAFCHTDGSTSDNASASSAA